MSNYYSGFADQIKMFVEYRKASGVWNEADYGLNLKYFDRFCAENFPDNNSLTQEMVDIWCSKRETELNKSCNKRTQAIRAFIKYLKERNMTDINIPKTLNNEPNSYFPHAFTHEELIRFFRECDNIKVRKGYHHQREIFKKITCPVFFRLLYSSGIRTTEARFLRRQDVDLQNGVLDIQKSKGKDQHYVALHETMTSLLRRYDNALDSLLPDRTYFFERILDGQLTKYWVSDNFKQLWIKANGYNSRAIAYDLRHNYAIQNINNWSIDGFEISDKLNYLSKSMGHRHFVSTTYYYSIVPRLVDTIKSKTEDGLNEIIPEVHYDE